MHSFHQMLVSQELGGAGLIALQLANFLTARDQESHVWIPGEGAAQRQAYQLGLRSHFYDSSSLFRQSNIKQFTANWRTGCLFHRYNPGLIHIHSPFYYRLLRLGVVISRLKSIVHVHLEEEEEGLRWALKRPPALIITCATFLVEHVRRTLPERYQKRQLIVSVPNAVDTERFSPGDKFAAKLRVDAPIGMPLVLMLANLAPHKGQETALRATAALKEVGVNIALWLAGVERGGERHYTMYLYALANDLGVGDRVQFLGQRDDAPDLLRAADLFLLPSTREGLPLSILEAQAMKVPVLAAPTSGIPEVVIDGETGFLIPADDERGYANRIKSFLENDKLYQYISEKSYAHVIMNHTIKSYCEKIYHLYLSLLNPESDAFAAC